MVDLCFVMWGAVDSDTFVRAIFVASHVLPSADLLPCMQTNIALGEVEVGCYDCKTHCDVGAGQIIPSICGSNNNRITIHVLTKNSGEGLAAVETTSPFLHNYEKVIEVDSSIVDTQFFGSHFYFLIMCELDYKPDALHLKTRTVHFLVSDHFSEVIDSLVHDNNKMRHLRCVMQLRAGDTDTGCIARIVKTPPGVVGISYC